MAYVAGTAVKSHEAPISNGLFAFAHNLVKFFERNAAYKRTVNELNGLSDLELNDIGLTRGEINVIARKSANIF